VPAAPTPKPATAARRAPTRLTGARATTAASGTKAAAVKPAPAAPAGRRLEDIHIEGEVPVPQVLFITARDQRRFLTSQHGRYLRSSGAIGAATPLPTRIALATDPVPVADTTGAGR
jgi:hypothetical protein